MKQKLTERRNVTISSTEAKALESASALTGLSQGNLISRALRHGAAGRLMTYVGKENPVVGILDLFQSELDFGDADPRIGKIILTGIREEWLPRIRVKSAPEVYRAQEMVGSYIMGHLPRWATDKSPFMNHLYEMCKSGEFSPSDSICVDEEKLRKLVSDYISEVTANPAFLSESYFYRNLAMILENLYTCREKDTKEFFLELADRNSRIFGISAEEIAG